MGTEINHTLETKQHTKENGSRRSLREPCSATPLSEVVAGRGGCLGGKAEAFLNIETLKPMNGRT